MPGRIKKGNKKRLYDSKRWERGHAIATRAKAMYVLVATSWNLLKVGIAIFSEQLQYIVGEI